MGAPADWVVFDRVGLTARSGETGDKTEDYYEGTRLLDRWGSPGTILANYPLRPGLRIAARRCQSRAGWLELGGGAEG